jgi:hypothetical protein
MIRPKALYVLVMCIITMKKQTEMRIAPLIGIKIPRRHTKAKKNKYMDKTMNLCGMCDAYSPMDDLRIAWAFPLPMLVMNDHATKLQYKAHMEKKTPTQRDMPA